MRKSIIALIILTLLVPGYLLVHDNLECRSAVPIVEYWLTHIGSSDIYAEPILEPINEVNADASSNKLLKIDSCERKGKFMQIVFEWQRNGYPERKTSRLVGMKTNDAWKIVPEEMIRTSDSQKYYIFKDACKAIVFFGQRYEGSCALIIEFLPRRRDRKVSLGSENKAFEITLNTSVGVLASSEKISKPIIVSPDSQPPRLILDYPYLKEGVDVYEINLWNMSIDGTCYMVPLKVQKSIQLKDIDDGGDIPDSISI
jgi:hypothetical protein